ncbi:MAG: glycosyltransferase family 4 protein [Ilumatobacteraceae bacterium]
MDLEWRFLMNAQHVFVMGPSTQEFLVTHGLPVERITVTGSGINAAIPPLRDRTSDAPNRLLFLGKEWERKGGPGLVEALRQVRLETSHQPMLDIVGCSPRLADDFCNVMGAIAPTELAPILDRASALAMPTRSEAFGVAYVEALSAGLPVLGSNVSNVPWIIGDAGLCPDPENMHEIAHGLVDLLNGYSVYANAAFVRGTTLRREWTWARVASTVLGQAGR